MRIPGGLSAAVVGWGLVAGAQAAVVFDHWESGNDAGAVAGSSDVFLGGSADNFNGTSNAIVLEALDPGVVWNQFSLVVTTSDNTQRPVAASFAGLSGVLLSAQDLPSVPGSEAPGGWAYTFAFNGPVAAGANSLTLSGLSTGLDLGSVQLTAMASAIPEPATGVMLLAGLGALGFLWRRRI